MAKASLEENLLCLLCWNEQYAPALTVKVNEKDFSTETWRRIAEVAINHIQKFKKPPQLHIRDLLERELREEKDEMYRFALSSMEQIHTQIQPEFVIAELDRFLEIRNLHKCLGEAAEALRKENLPEVYKFLNSATPPRTGPSGIWMNNTKQALSFMDNSWDNDFFSSGVEALDKQNIYPERKTITVLMAETGKGKTWWTIQVGKHAVMRRKKVLHITLELSEKRVAQRYIQSMFGMARRESDVVDTGEFTKDDRGYFVNFQRGVEKVEGINEDTRQKLVKDLEIMQGRHLLIKEFPAGTLTFPQLRSYIFSLERTDGFIPDLVVLDYPEKMAVNSKEYRLDIGRLNVSLRGLASELNAALIAPSQTSKVAVGKKWVTRREVSEDFSKVMNTDYFITYSQTDREEKLGMARLLVDKAREEKGGQRIWVLQNYAIGQFCIDSCLMNDNATKALRRMAGEDD
jgi:replicative DNA helicase